MPTPAAGKRQRRFFVWAVFRVGALSRLRRDRVGERPDVALMLDEQTRTSLKRSSGRRPADPHGFTRGGFLQAKSARRDPGAGGSIAPSADARDGDIEALRGAISFKRAAGHAASCAVTGRGVADAAFARGASNSGGVAAWRA